MRHAEDFWDIEEAIRDDMICVTIVTDSGARLGTSLVLFHRKTNPRLDLLTVPRPTFSSSACPSFQTSPHRSSHIFSDVQCEIV